jgi:hypothetical protein
VTTAALWRRIRRIEEDLFLPPSGYSPVLIHIAGGLPNGGDVLHATIGRDLHLEAAPQETVAEFEDRCSDEATKIGAEFVVIGGLRPTPR